MGAVAAPQISEIELGNLIFFIIINISGTVLFCCKRILLRFFLTVFFLQYLTLHLIGRRYNETHSTDMIFVVSSYQ